jgi:ADP-ribose pyrophosphatase
VSGDFRQVGEVVLHTSHVMRLVAGTFESPDGVTFQRDVIRHPGAVGVVAIDGDDVILVRQYRPAIDRWLLEIPAGTRDSEGEPVMACAVRELAEEVGATAELMEHLTTYVVAPGISDEEMALFVARGLTFGKTEADGPEEAAMTVERVALADVPALVRQGAIEDAKTIVGLLFVTALG